MKKASRRTHIWRTEQSGVLSKAGKGLNDYDSVLAHEIGHIVDYSNPDKAYTHSLGEWNRMFEGAKKIVIYVF